MELSEKGCVYFFRHIGLSPVKIGFSTNESPLSRFEQFKTYAPYGSELLGFIMCENSKDLETTLHQRFSYARLKGEWFEITKEEVDKVVSFYSNIEDIKVKNEFEIAWAKKINAKSKSVEELEGNVFVFESLFSKYKNYDFTERVVLNKSELAKVLSVTKKELYDIIDFYELEYKANRESGIAKKGFVLYKYVNKL